MLYITSNVLNTIKTKKAMDKEIEMHIKELNNAQAIALQFQMSPHFLYNTLETIKWCSIEDMGVGNRTSKAITKLAKLYRIGMDKENFILSLQEELEFTRVYVDALCLRFGDKIRYEWNVESEVNQCNVLKMCMQPLIENAVNHGLKNNLYYGNIAISIFKENNTIFIVVDDDGVGLTSGELMVLNETLKGKRKNMDTGIGLQNVNRRIKLIFGEEYGVGLKKTEKYSHGVSAVISLPYIEKAKE